MNQHIDDVLKQIASNNLQIKKIGKEKQSDIQKNKNILNLFVFHLKSVFNLIVNIDVFINLYKSLKLIENSLKDTVNAAEFKQKQFDNDYLKLIQKIKLEENFESIKEEVKSDSDTLLQNISNVISLLSNTSKSHEKSMLFIHHEFESDLIKSSLNYKFLLFPFMISKLKENIENLNRKVEARTQMIILDKINIDMKIESELELQRVLDEYSI